ncbi:MAG: hypothetical protein ABI366_08080 [Ginsengibacter sp.]
MVEVFKTNVHEVEKSNIIFQKLQKHFPGNQINFDLEDCDKILRVEGTNILSEKIIEMLKEEGHSCEILF